MSTQANNANLDAVLVGYEDQENLGLRSILSSLRAAGFRAEILPFSNAGQKDCIESIVLSKPKLVGLSIIFQYSTDDFASFARALRAAGCRAHITVGGHFPSLRAREVLEAFPEFDSIVRFEGELTAAELMIKVDHPETWDSILGLAFRRDSRIIVNPVRPLVRDLDSLPPPARDSFPVMPRGIRAASLLASRGCLHDCSFCSIRQFYGQAGRPLRRARSPEAVVDEMHSLLTDHGINFFIFQDDDFAAKSRAQMQWIEAFLKALDRKGLTGRVGWKISCRVDDIRADLIRECQGRGLLLVYLGVESGNDPGLQTLNKHVTVPDNLHALETLRVLGLGVDIGFMLFDPDSSFETVRENISFLREGCSGGLCPVDFGKMLPYAGTPIEARLVKEGRLRGTLTDPDYDFLDHRLDFYAHFVGHAFRHRHGGGMGLIERLTHARYDQLLAPLKDGSVATGSYQEGWRDLVEQTNHVATETLERGLAFMSERDLDEILRDWEALDDFARDEWRMEIALQRRLDELLEYHAPSLALSYRQRVVEFRRRGMADLVPFTMTAEKAA